jgi:hypothetical protein
MLQSPKIDDNLSMISALSDDDFHRLPLKRVAPSRREYVIDMKPPPPNSINITGSSSVTSTIGSTSVASTSRKQLQPRPVLRAVSARRDPRRKCDQSVKNPNDGHGLGLSPPTEPQRNRALIVKRDSYKEPPYFGGNDHQHQEGQEEQGCIMIEVTPGVKLPLRGSAETWRAIEEGSVTVTMCCGCKIDLNCVLDAQLVICPDCFILSPVDQTEQGAAESSTSMMHRRGVGVGIKAEEIRQWVMSNSE